jgi:hypothetical protein
VFKAYQVFRAHCIRNGLWVVMASGRCVGCVLRRYGNLNAPLFRILNLLLGQAVASYTIDTQTLTVYHLPSDATKSLELSNIVSLIVLKDTIKQASLLAVAADCSITQLYCLIPSQNSKMQLNFLGPTPFPVPTPGDVPALVLSVDPMGWSFTPDDSPAPHDSLLSISKTGVLAFWAVSADGQWRATGQVHTQRTGIKLARCSTAKKSALGMLEPIDHFLALKSLYD